MAYELSIQNYIGSFDAFIWMRQNRLEAHCNNIVVLEFARTNDNEREAH